MLRMRNTIPGGGELGKGLEEGDETRGRGTKRKITGRRRRAWTLKEQREVEGLSESKEPTPLREHSANTCALGEDRYIPAVGRFLIVCTFLEDALRIITQWNDQLTYLKEYRKSMSRTACPLPFLLPSDQN